MSFPLYWLFSLMVAAGQHMLFSNLFFANLVTPTSNWTWTWTWTEAIVEAARHNVLFLDRLHWLKFLRVKQPVDKVLMLPSMHGSALLQVEHFDFGVDKGSKDRNILTKIAIPHGGLKDFWIPNYILSSESGVKKPSHISASPMLVFVNSRSGGKLGGELLISYKTLLDKIWLPILATRK
ncbi:hypothetical protein L1987_70886 [Smallanthus sonchifolius]|uniref:Uncharacterized protein n=1 Tax=Smallanthus sonchifolius TaxID=185202 RepID=A0ACB9AQ19_9ASTR|nr:hypothetical protein L1987_70886 [Smallanthus sonchifolius]